MANHGFFHARETSSYRPAPAFRRLPVETLEDRRLLDAGGCSVELLDSSAAPFFQYGELWTDDPAGHLFSESRVRETHQVDSPEDSLDEIYAPDEATAPLFGPPEALNTNAGSDSGSDWSPQVTTDGTGNWVAGCE